MQYSTNKIHFGKNSNRRFNEGNGHLYVTDCILTSACVSEYLGKEIQGYEALGLDANTRYGVLRPREEIEKAIDTYKGLSLLDKHIAVSAEIPQEKYWLGSVGTDAKMDGNDLFNTVIVWKKTAIDAITKADNGDPNGKKDLSVGYLYDLVKEDGTFEGKQYKFKMTNIRANHVALVEDGRVEGAQIADSNIKNNNFKDLIMKKHGFLNTLFSWALDAQMKDSSELEKEVKELKAKAEDEFEGGAKEKQEMLDSMESKLEEMKKKEADDQKAKDSKKAKDSETKESKEPKEAGADNEPEEKEKKTSQTADSAIAMDEKAIAKKASEMALEMMKENVQITALCEKVIGKLPESMLYDSIDNKINKTLKIAQKDTDYSNKSQDVKIAVLETLAMGKQQKVAPNYAAQYTADANVAKNTANPLLKMIKGVN